jgi:hypothetical protein
VTPSSAAQVEIVVPPLQTIAFKSSGFLVVKELILSDELPWLRAEVDRF